MFDKSRKPLVDTHTHDPPIFGAHTLSILPVPFHAINFQNSFHIKKVKSDRTSSAHSFFSLLHYSLSLSSILLFHLKSKQNQNFNFSISLQLKHTSKKKTCGDINSNPHYSCYNNKLGPNLLYTRLDLKQQPQPPEQLFLNLITDGTCSIVTVVCILVLLVLVEFMLIIMMMILEYMMIYRLRKRRS